METRLSVAPPPRAAAAAPSRGVAVAAIGLARRFALPAGGTLDAMGPIDLALEPGEFFSVVGPSGCGKTTLLQLLAGLDRSSAGSVSVGATAVDGAVPDGVGVVFQEDSTFPWLSVRDNVAFSLRRAGIPRAEAAARVADAVRLMGLQEFIDAKPAQLSGGMRQRVCIARSLVMRPRLLLLDEPFGALDQQTRLLMGEELLKLWRGTGATVLLITHSLDEAAMLSDRIGVMSARPGRILEIVETGWPSERDTGVSELPRFSDITRQLWQRLRVESMKSLGGRP